VCRWATSEPDDFSRGYVRKVDSKVIIEVVIVGKESIGTFRIKKKDAVFYDEGLQDKLEILYDRRRDAEDDIYDINLEMEDINERFVGCE
jgi:hypothetical protein